jgi:hypothetical protein
MWGMDDFLHSKGMHILTTRNLHSLCDSSHVSGRFLLHSAADIPNDSWIFRGVHRQNKARLK